MKMLFCIPVVFALLPAWTIGENAAGSPPMVMDPLRVYGYSPLEKVASHRLSIGRKGAAVVADGDYLYIIGGASASGDMIEQIERFNLKTNAAESFGRLKHGRIFHSAVLIGGKVIVLGGSSAQEPVGGIPASFGEERHRGAPPGMAPELRSSLVTNAI